MTLKAEKTVSLEQQKINRQKREDMSGALGFAAFAALSGYAVAATIQRLDDPQDLQQGKLPWVSEDLGDQVSFLLGASFVCFATGTLAIFAVLSLLVRGRCQQTKSNDQQRQKSSSLDVYNPLSASDEKKNNNWAHIPYHLFGALCAGSAAMLWILGSFEKRVCDSDSAAYAGTPLVDYFCGTDTASTEFQVIGYLVASSVCMVGVIGSMAAGLFNVQCHPADASLICAKANGFPPV